MIEDTELQQRRAAYRNLEYAYAVCLGALKAIQSGFCDHHYDKSASIKRLASDALIEAREMTGKNRERV